MSQLIHTFDSFSKEGFFLLDRNSDRVRPIQNSERITREVVLMLFPQNEELTAFSYRNMNSLLNQLRKRDISVVVKNLKAKEVSSSIRTINELAKKIFPTIIGEIVCGHGTVRDIQLGEKLTAIKLRGAFKPFDQDSFFVTFMSCSTGEYFAREVSRSYTNITFFAPLFNIVGDNVIFHKNKFFFTTIKVGVLVTENIRNTLDKYTTSYRKGRRWILSLPTSLSQKILDASEEEALTYLSGKKNKDFFKTDSIGLNPVHDAVTRGYVQVLKSILSRLSEADRKKILHMPGLLGLTPLMIAIQSNKPRVIHFLLEQESIIDLTTPNDMGNTALHLAVEKGYLDIVEMLLRKKPELLDIVGYNGWTPLQTAVFNGQKEIVDFLLNSSYAMHLQHKDVDGNTALHLDAREGHLKIFEMLLRKKPELLDIVGDNGWTPLQTAVFYEQKELVDFLLNSSYAVDLQHKDFYENTVLHLAVEGGSLDIVEMLLRKMPELLHVQGFNGRTPLQTAVFYGMKEIVDFLLNASFEMDLQHKDFDGNTALHLAIEKGRLDIVEMLLGKMPELLDILGYHGRTPLQTAVFYGQKKIVHFLSTPSKSCCIIL